jgi:hypothetical protein
LGAGIAVVTSKAVLHRPILGILKRITDLARVQRVLAACGDTFASNQTGGVWTVAEQAFIDLTVTVVIHGVAGLCGGCGRIAGT